MTDVTVTYFNYFLSLLRLRFRKTSKPYQLNYLRCKLTGYSYTDGYIAYYTTKYKRRSSNFHAKFFLLLPPT